MRVRFLIMAFLSLCSYATQCSFAQEATESLSKPQAEVLDDETWKRLDDSVERALSWLATQQKDDGSFESIDMGHPKGPTKNMAAVIQLPLVFCRSACTTSCCRFFRDS